MDQNNGTAAPLMKPFFAAKALGGEFAGRNTVRCPGPGHSFRDRSLSVSFTGDDFTVFSFAGDDWKLCRDHVRDRLGLGDFQPTARRPAPVIIAPAPDDRDRTQRAISIWNEARPIEQTPAERYLASRGVAYNGEALRWHPACPFGKERYGCIVALVRNIVTNDPQAIHRTAIDASGRRRDRKALGPIGSGTVKLVDNADVTTVIAIGEGIETAMSIRNLPNMESIPVWSVISAPGIASFPALPGIEAVWIAADNDASGTGRKAAISAAERFMGANIETIIVEPLCTGTDLNDLANVATTSAFPKKDSSRHVA